MSLASALERAAEALPNLAEDIRPANGDPERLLDGLRAEAATEVAGWLLANDLDAAAELLDAWVDSERGAVSVLGLAGGELPKAARKLVRRAHHQLRGRGIVVPEEAPAATVARLPAVEDDVSAAAVTPLDPTGACLAYLMERNPTGGARLFEVALDEERGILDTQVYSAGRGKLRGFLKEISERSRLAAVPAPREAVQALIARAVAAHPEERPFPSAFAEWRSALAGAREASEAPGECLRATLEPAAADALEAVAARAREGQLGPWLPMPLFERAAERLRELGESRIIVSGSQRREQAEEILAETLEEAFTGDAGERAARRFRHQAFVLDARGEPDEARELLAAAEAFAAGDPARNPVARALVERPLQALLAQLAEDEREADDASLIVKPGRG